MGKDKKEATLRMCHPKWNISNHLENKIHTCTHVYAASKLSATRILFWEKKKPHKIMSVFIDWPKPQNTEGDVELKNGSNEWKKNLRVVKTK